MSDDRSDRIGSWGRPGKAAFLIILGLLALVAWQIGTDVAAADSKRRVVLGAAGGPVTPNCGPKAGTRACRVEGKVTGFQILQGGATGRSFVVPFRRGKVVAWSVALSAPTRSDTARFGPAQGPYFDALFGSPSRARISVLRPVKGAGKGIQYRLIRQSGAQTLNRYFGSTIKFALIEPLNVLRGDVVALTILTWAPTFWVPSACDVLRDGSLAFPARCERSQKLNTWRASRSRGKCNIGTDAHDNPNEALQKTRPQQKVRSVRAYGCYYAASRLLYTATVLSR